ncbi:hypothetical protein IWZ01DRAFT_563413 [Phyllosticta capitalensis]
MRETMALFNNAIRIGEDGAGTDDAELVNALVRRNMKFEETLREWGFDDEGLSTVRVLDIARPRLHRAVNLNAELRPQSWPLNSPILHDGLINMATERNMGDVVKSEGESIELAATETTANTEIQPDIKTESPANGSMDHYLAIMMGNDEEAKKRLYPEETAVLQHFGDYVNQAAGDNVEERKKLCKILEQALMGHFEELLQGHIEHGWNLCKKFDQDKVFVRALEDKLEQKKLEMGALKTEMEEKAKEVGLLMKKLQEDGYEGEKWEMLAMLDGILKLELGDSQSGDK